MKKFTVDRLGYRKDQRVPLKETIRQPTMIASKNLANLIFSLVDQQDRKILPF